MYNQTERINNIDSVEMDNEREEDDEIDLTTIERASSLDSLEQTESLRFVSGCHRWINSNEKLRVENSYLFNDSIDSHQTFSIIPNKNPVEVNDDDDDNSQTDLSLNHFDVQLQVNHGQLQQVIRYGVFSSKLPLDVNTLKTNQSSQTIEPEMDMNGGDHRRNGKSNNHSQQQSSNNNGGGGGGGSGRNPQSNGGSAGNGGGDGNGWNPNRNNNNSRRPDDDGSDNDDDETDESVARRLGFQPIDNETIRVINRIRGLTRRLTFDQQDLENVQYLLEELIRFQHLENSSDDQFGKIVDYLKLHHVFHSKARALAFIQDRLPSRTNRTTNDNNSNVFNIWRERERRARLDSKDSLEDEGQNSNEYRDVIEIQHPASNGRSKVKQMARHIDTRSASSRVKEPGRSASPSPSNRDSNGTHHETLIRRNISPNSASEQRRVREMIDRLESSSNSPTAKKFSTKKSFPDDAPTRRIARREEHENTVINTNNGGFTFRHKSPRGDIYVRENPPNVTRFEINQDEILNGGQRITTGTTIDDYVTTLLPDTETSISMVRDIRARLYEDDSALARTDVENIPVKLDLETLYILEQKATDKQSLSSSVNIHLPDSNRSERFDSAMQTTIPISTIKPSNRPIGIQVESNVEHNTVAAQTTDSLHRPLRERQNILSSGSDEEDETSKFIRTTTTTSRYEVKRRRSSHHTSEDEDDGANGSTVIYLDDKENFQTKPADGMIVERSASQSRQSHRQVARRQVEQYADEEHRSNEVYEIHTRGACKCLVVSYEENTQYGPETRFEKQLKHIESTYTEEELRATELHVIVTSSDGDYQLVRRDYGTNISYDDKARQPTVTIHYYTKEGHRMRTEQARHLEHLPLFIRCEIEYELNHYGSAQLIVLSVTNAERRQANVSVKKETVDETVARLSGRYAPNSPEIEHEIARRLAEPVSLLHLVDYSSREDFHQTNSTDLRRVSGTDVSTSLRIVQRYRTIIHRLCQVNRSHLRLTPQAEQQRHLILVARDEYYLLDLVSQASSSFTQRTESQQRHVTHQPFDYAKYRRDMAQQQRILERHCRQTHPGPPPGHPPEPEFYLGAGRRAIIEREIRSMRESIRPHEHAPPHYKHEPRRRTVSISYSGGQRYVRARIIHVKDYYEDCQRSKQQRDAKEQELFVRVDDYINESAANSLRRSYSRDYLHEDGPRSRIRYIRIPGETIRIEEKTTYERQGIMYANLPYSLRYWNILNILDREAREGRPLGSSLPHVIVNDPYQTVIPPLTQQEIRQTAQQVLSPQYYPRTYTDKTLRWFLSRDNRTEIESANYLQALHQYQHQHQQRQANVRVQEGGRQGVAKKYFVTETLVRYEKMPDRLVPVSVNDRSQSIDNLHHRSPSNLRRADQTYHSQNYLNRSQSQTRPPTYSLSTPYIADFHGQSPSTHVPLSRHQSVHELHAASTLSHPPSPSPSLHSLHSNHQYYQQQQQHRRPVAFHTRYQPRCPFQQQAQQNPLFTEVIDSQTGQRILTTSQEELPSAVRGLLNHYKNFQQF